jgi:hypothetical protein
MPSPAYYPAQPHYTSLPDARLLQTSKSHFPAALEGLRILQLGLGSGEAHRLLADSTGACGEVIVVADPTAAPQANGARSLPLVTEHNNLSLILAAEQDLSQLPLAPGSFDLIYSHPQDPCCPAYSSAFLAELLKTGGEWWSCQSTPEDAAPQAGFIGPFRLHLGHQAVAVRRFKASSRIQPKHPRLTYLGTLSDSPAQLVFDDQHSLPTGQDTELPLAVYQALIHSRFREHLQLHSAALTCGLFARGRS